MALYPQSKVQEYRDLERHQIFRTVAKLTTYCYRAGDYTATSRADILLSQKDLAPYTHEQNGSAERSGGVII